MKPDAEWSWSLSTHTAKSFTAIDFHASKKTGEDNCVEHSWWNFIKVINANIEPGAIKCSFSPECSPCAAKRAHFSPAPRLLYNASGKWDVRGQNTLVHSLDVCAHYISFKMHTAGFVLKRRRCQEEIMNWARHQQLPAAPTELTHARTVASNNEYYGLVNYVVLNFHRALHGAHIISDTMRGVLVVTRSHRSTCTLSPSELFAIKGESEIISLSHFRKLQTRANL